MKIEQLQSGNQDIRLNSHIYTEQDHSFNYTIIITHEKCWLDVALKISLQNSLLTTLLLLPNFRQGLS